MMRDPATTIGRLRVAALAGTIAVAASAGSVTAAGAQEQPPAQAAPPAPEKKQASLENSAMRGLTYKAATTLTNLVAYSYFTGSGMAGTAISAILGSYSYVTYVSTDYLWDTLYPRSAGPQTSAEVMGESAARSTGKFFLYKAVNLPVVLATSYYATGSVMGMIGLYSGLSAFKAGLFYANNMAWDYYDTTPAVPAPAHRQAVRP